MDRPLVEGELNQVKDATEQLAKFNELFDSICVKLDDAQDPFTRTVLPMDVMELDESVVGNKDQLLEDITSYTLLTAYVVDHPLIQIIKQIRDESVVTEDDTLVLHLKDKIDVGQIYTHYKGTDYLISSIAYDSNNPKIKHIHYTDGIKTWSLTLAEFCKRVEFEGKMVNRFQIKSA